MYISARWVGGPPQQIDVNINIRMCTHLLAFRVARSCRHLAAVVPLATILASARRPRLIDLESQVLRCTPTLQEKRNIYIYIINKTCGRDRQHYPVLRGSRSQRFDQSLRQSCGMRQGRILCARDRGDRARRGGITRIRRSRENACPFRRRRRRRRRPRVVVGPG